MKPQLSIIIPVVNEAGQIAVKPQTTFDAETKSRSVTTAVIATAACSNACSSVGAMLRMPMSASCSECSQGGIDLLFNGAPRHV